MELRKLFDEWASGRDQYRDRQWLLSKWDVFDGIVWPDDKIQAMLDHVTAGLDLHPGLTLVDLGCGGGWIRARLAARVRLAVGLDFSQEMLRQARAFDPLGTYVGGEIGRLPLRPESVDRALSYFVFLNFMDDDVVGRAFADVWRILKPGGRALIGQLPDRDGSAAYDAAKAAYWEHCRTSCDLGESTREICPAPQKLFDRPRLEASLAAAGITFRIRHSFNPFLAPGQPLTVPWRFDVMMEKPL